MEEKSVKNGLLLLWQGLKMSSVCAGKIWLASVRKAIVDTVKGIIKHPILAFIIVGTIVYQFRVICTQRIERDINSIKEYNLEQTLDSVKLVNDLATYRNGHINEDTARIGN